MIRCPNLRDEKVREDFNGVLERLGGLAMSAGDVSPRQPYVAKLNDVQTSAYNIAHYLWNAHTAPAEIGKFLDALDQVQGALQKPVSANQDQQIKEQKPEAAQAVRATDQTDEGKAAPAVSLARALVYRIGRGKLTAKDLQAEATKAYGGTLAEGTFDRKDMQDALELAVNMHIADTRHLRVDSPNPRQAIKMLGEVLDDLPAQRVRSEEQESFQQFSTPPNYSAAAAYAANLRKGDTMLEPSAGTGSLVAASMAPGVKIIANELSERRVELLKALVGDRGEVLNENAEQIDNILPDRIKPTVVVMNPPFSQTAGRMGDRKDVMVAANHIAQALGRLEPGGRLVAIVGRGMTMGAPAYRPWWGKISKEYSVRANIGVEGKVYEKYGTTFGTRLLVIDKVQPGEGDKPLLADAQSADELMRLLEPIRDARPQNAADQQHAAQPGGAGVAQAGAQEVRPGAPSSVPAATGGEGAQGGGARGVSAEPQARPGAAGGADVRVEAGKRAEVDADQSERPGAKRTAKGAAARADAGGQPEEGGRGGAVDNLRTPAGGDDAATARSERIELEHAEPGTQGASEISESLYDNYRPQRVKVPGAKSHPSKLVESAAMASVPPPKPTYTPRLPKAVIEKGLLSDAQLEPVIYAGEAHGKMLPAAEGEKAKRKGFFIGDGTGVGKGREVAGIILDNWQQGRKKAIWISEKKTLLQDAKRDWSGLEQDPSVLFDVGKVKTGEPVLAKQGIGFITYDTLKGGMSDQRALARGAFVRKQEVSVNGQSGTVQKIERAASRKDVDKITVKLANGTTVTVPANEVVSQGKANVKSRVDQLVDWFGEDFDGVIAFDEAHNMGNATDIKGERGQKDAAQKAIAGMALQDRLPNARIVYVSATGATEVSNLSYADRLGLWGRGTAFASRAKFVSEVEGGGIAAMELIARDMKQLGLYSARNLSYDGVEYERLEHKLSDPQREIYDTLAEAWQVVLRNINEALKATGGDKDSRAKSAAMSAFWGGHQRFFNQVVTSMQMPSVIKAVEKDLAEGRQAVLQLTNTNEASQERAAAKAESAEDIEDLDITPRDQIIQLVETSFPTQEYEEYLDENGKVRARPVVDKDGNPVQNKQAVRMRDALVERLASVRVPQGPLDMVLDHFGIDTVAEVTGRGRRFVMKTDEKTGQRKRMEENRPGSSNIAETDSFQNGSKKILIFSEAGGTGRSYHADKTAPSKGNRRVHYLVQGGWRADKAVQGFGRTHRSNQASAPIFKLVTTDLQGQKRFISSIARRLGQLGALTKGQRQAGDQGIFSARDNLESTEANQALRQFFTDVVRDAIPGVPVAEFEEQTGLKIRQKDDEGRSQGALQEFPPITQFLNRLLSLKIDLQNKVFEAFSERLDTVIEARRQAGLLDVGLETVKADKISKDSEQVVHTVEGTDAETKYVKLTLHNKFHPTDFKAVAKNEWRKVVKWVESPNGKVYAVAEAPGLTDEGGNIVDNYRLVSPVSDARLVPQVNLDRRGKDGAPLWKTIEQDRAREMWQAEIAKAPEYITRDMHLVTGAILPIWDRLKGNPRVVRLQTDKGERFIGRVIPNDVLAQTLKNLGAEAKGKKVEPGDVFAKLTQGGRATLSNGWTLSRRTVAGEHRIELKGPQSFSEGQDVKRDGLFTEKIDYKLRYFIPTDDVTGPEVLRKLLQYRPVVDLSEPGAAPEGMAAGDEPSFALRGWDTAETAHEPLTETEKRSVRSGALEMRQPFTETFQEHAAAIGPLLRRELDRLGLKDVALKLVDQIEVFINGHRRGTADGYYFKKAITLALDSDGKFKFLHHEALHGLRKLGVFKDSEWGILEQAAERKWRKQFDIEAKYEHATEDTKNEEGIAHAYAAWANGEMKVDGRIARLFKRIRDFLEAVRNAFKGLGFKSAEDVFRDIRSGEVGGRRAAAEGEGGEPQFSLKEEEQVAHFQKYYRSWTFDSVAEGRQKIRENIIRTNEQYKGLFGETDPNIVNKLTFVKSGKGFKLSQRGLGPKRAPVEIHDEPTGNAPDVNWSGRDNINNGSAASAMKNYGRGKGVATQGYIDVDALSQEKLAGGAGAYSWDELQSSGRRSAPPPATIRLNKNGTVTIMDGNHRIRFWKEQGYDQIPAYIIDERETPRGANEEPLFSMRSEAGPASAAPTPNLNTRIRDGIESVLERAKPMGDKFIEGTQDLSHPVKLLQEDLERRREAAFEDPEAFYVRKRLYPGRLGAWVDTFNKRHLDGIVKLLKANGITLKEASDYLYALHAPERNAAMGAINPTLEAGSGMTNEDAEKIIAGVKASGQAAAYDELRQRVGAIRELILNIMEKAGLEKAEVIAEWRKRYQDYVPLRGWEEMPEDAPPEFKGTGKGFNIRGKEVKQAFGRRSKADNPLVNLFDQAYRTFDRAERNRYLQSLYRALDAMKNDVEDVATLDKGEPKRKIDPRTGLVRVYEGSANYFNPKAVFLKFNGDPHYIVFKDQALAEAAKNMSPTGIGVFEGLLAFQNKLKALWTHYSPDFLLRHFLFRYPIEGTLNSFEQKETGPHSVKQYVKDALPFMGNASKAIFTTNKGVTHDKPAVAEMQTYWKEMRSAGGAMVFRNMRDVDLLREHFETALKDLSANKFQNARARWRRGVEVMDTMTNALDNSLRLAAYASARKQGKTPQQAALIAREATVDFQLKGKWSKGLGLFFIFGNVAIQTAARMTKAVYRSKIMRRVFGSLIMTGFTTAAFNYLVAGNDKDGIPFFEKIPEWERRLNFIVLNPWDTDAKGRPQPTKIPMPYNYAFPLALGYIMGTTIFGKESVRKRLAMLTKSALETFTPMGSEENKVAAVTPELFRPFVHLYTNEDWAGRPIHKDATFQKGPNAYSGRRTTGQGWQKIAEGVNAATGGTRTKSGYVDLHPEDYREFIGHYIGTQLRLGANLWDVGSAIAQGKAPPPTKTPLARVVRGADYDAADRAHAFEMRDKAKHPWKF